MIDEFLTTVMQLWAAISIYHCVSPKRLVSSMIHCAGSESQHEETRVCFPKCYRQRITAVRKTCRMKQVTRVCSGSFKKANILDVHCTTKLQCECSQRLTEAGAQLSRQILHSSQGQSSNLALEQVQDSAPACVPNSSPQRIDVEDHRHLDQAKRQHARDETCT